MPSLDLTPEPLSITAKRGMTWEWSLLWKDSAGDPIDNTGYDFYFTMRVAPDDVTPVLALSTQEGSITGSGSTGFINFLVAASVTNVASRRYVFACTSDNGAGDLRPVSEGTLTVED